MRTAKWIGLTGGIAAGKTMVADWFVQKGIPVFDLDKLGRSLSVTPQAARVFESIFGEEIFTHGVINRRLVRDQMFQSPEKRKALEDYLHPLIWKEFEKLAAEAEEKGKRIIVCEAALVIEAKLHQNLDEVIVVVANEKLRKERALKRDQMDEALFDAVQKTQVSDEDRKTHATHLVMNDGHFDHVTPQLSKILDGWKKKGWL